MGYPWCRQAPWHEWQKATATDWRKMAVPHSPTSACRIFWMHYFRETVTWKYSGSVGSDLPETACRMHTVYIKTATKLFFFFFFFFFLTCCLHLWGEQSSGLNDLEVCAWTPKTCSTHDEYVPKLMGRLLLVCSQLFLQTNARSV
mgnify:CR=1 FL=1